MADAGLMASALGARRLLLIATFAKPVASRARIARKHPIVINDHRLVTARFSGTVICRSRARVCTSHTRVLRAKLASLL
jgi:hypothetical protein